MRLVVDASVAVKWIVREEGSDAATFLRNAGHEIFAPRLMATEVGNTLRRKAILGDLERSKAEQLAGAIPLMLVSWIMDEVLSAEAVKLALALNATVPDCLYLALAEFIGATLVTADIRFFNAISNTEHQDSVIALDAFARA